MTDKNDGGQAFPTEMVAPGYYQNGGSGSFWEMQPAKPGMSLRDYFAGQALAESTREIWSSHKYEDVAKRAYGIADAMLKQRET